MGTAAHDQPRGFFSALIHDHARFEGRLKALELAAHRLCRAEDDSAALGTVAETLGFFAGEGARHEDTERLTLFPRLQQLPAFKQILSALEFQHRMNSDAGRELAGHVERFGPGSSRELLRLALRFAEMHRGHAIAEERALFPLAASVLPPQVLAEMGRELEERERTGGPYS